MQWVGMPKPTQEEIEQEAVSFIRMLMEWKKRNDRPGAKWKVGTTKYEVARLENPNTTYIALSGWKFGSAHIAAQEIAQYHGMKIEGNTDRNDATIFVYTDRPPTMAERKRRDKDPLSLKQKIVFRAIEAFEETNGKGPTKTELMKILGHRSAKTTNEYLDILERKNWTIVTVGQRRIELI